MEKHRSLTRLTLPVLEMETQAFSKTGWVSNAEINILSYTISINRTKESVQMQL